MINDINLMEVAYYDVISNPDEISKIIRPVFAIWKNNNQINKDF